MSALPTSPLAPAAFPEMPPVAGAQFASVAAGLRYKNRHDLTLMTVPAGSSVAGVFTQSSTAGHPVIWSQKVLANGSGQAVIVNAGNANVFRTQEGDDAVQAEAAAVATALGIDADQVFVASTGVIGERLPVDGICAEVPKLAANLTDHGIGDAAEAIMTTDTFKKGAFAYCKVDGKPVTVAGIAKGSGMIAPNMATMLAFVFTDAVIARNRLQAMVSAITDRTFNAITVDSDTSTSDTLLVFATGQADHAADADLADFEQALEAICLDLALQIVKDGEGAQKLIKVTVEGAATNQSARTIGLSIANSPLVKTAIAGCDANWGRVIMAIGKAGEPIDQRLIAVSFGGHPVAVAGGAVPDLDEAPIAAHLQDREIDLAVTVGNGSGSATVWTCDLTHGYIDINADYRS